MSARIRSALKVGLSYATEELGRVDTDVRSADAELLVRGLPVRRVHTAAGKRHYTGAFWSSTTRTQHYYESRLELDRLWLADFDPSVAWMAAQPFWLWGRDGTVVRRHVPDLLLKLGSGSFVVVDVKPATFQLEPRAAEVLRWTAGVCAAKQWRYEVWGGGDKIELANIRYLGRARRQFLRPKRDMDLTAHCDPAGRPWREIRAELVRAQVSIPDLCISAMLWQGRWVADLARPLDSSSVLRTGEAWS
ncbi:TnsA-like heteromeric transposase endonuclease subunit [Nocardia sp. X0981]